MFSSETQNLILLIDGILDGFGISYIVGGVIIVFGKMLVGGGFTKSYIGRTMNLMWYISKWPALAYVIFDPFAHWACGLKMDGWYWLFEAFNIWNWYWYRNVGDDDDFWKKELKKLTDKIVQIGGKLITLPEPA